MGGIHYLEIEEEEIEWSAGDGLAEWRLVLLLYLQMMIYLHHSTLDSTVEVEGCCCCSAGQQMKRTGRKWPGPA
jgi:hypothetical protein